VSEVQHFGNAVNHGVTQRDERIDTAKAQAAYQCLKKVCHKPSPFPCCAAAGRIVGFVLTGNKQRFLPGGKSRPEGWPVFGIICHYNRQSIKCEESFEESTLIFIIYTLKYTQINQRQPNHPDQPAAYREATPSWMIIA
jgi:hypothetical protein